MRKVKLLQLLNGTKLEHFILPPVLLKKEDMHGMIKYLIGAGGWAYFRVPGLRPLVAYSRLFDFVEVNSTFYEIPSLEAVQSWRRQVPQNFEFSVLYNRALTHKYRLQPSEEAYSIFDKMTTICKTLRVDVLQRAR